MFVENVNDSSKSPRDFDVVDFLSKLKRKEVQLNTSWFDKSFMHCNHLEAECLVSLRLTLCCFWSRSRLEAERGCSSDPDTKTRASPTEPARCCCTLKTVFKEKQLTVNDAGIFLDYHITLMSTKKTLFTFNGSWVKIVDWNLTSDIFVWKTSDTFRENIKNTKTILDELLKT